MHAVKPSRRRCSSSMRSSIRSLHVRDNLDQSALSGIRLAGSLANSTPISSSVNPIRCAKTMKAMRRNTAQRFAAADAFVIVTPEYNHSFPTPLKTAIDWHSTQWHAKPVSFVSYGGASGGLRAVEHLRQAFAEVHAVTVRNSISFHGVWDTSNPMAA